MIPPIVTGKQSISAGQDWTTSISGQLTILGEDSNTQNTGTKKSKRTGNGSGGGSVGTGNGDAGSGGSGGETKNQIQNEKEPVRDDNFSDQEIKSQQEEQLNKQDQCPPGYYFSEEIGDCVLEDIDIEEEKSSKESVAKERYDKWREQAIKYMSSINGMGYYIAQEAFFENQRSFGDLSGRQTYTMIYAYFENAVAHAKQIKKLSTWDGQNIGPELEKLMFEEYDRNPKGIKLPNSNILKTLDAIAFNARQVHNVVDFKNAEDLKKHWRTATQKGLEGILDAKASGKFKANTANEEVILKYKDYYSAEVSEPTEPPSNVVEVYRSIEIISPSAIEYVSQSRSLRCLFLLLFLLNH